MPTQPQGNPEIVDLDFPLGRKLTFAGNSWRVTGRITPAAARGSFLILPGARALLITYLSISASAAVTPGWGSATAVATPIALAPLNSNVISANVPSFTAFSSVTGAPTTPVSYEIFDLAATSPVIDVDFYNDPVFLPANSLTGFLVDTRQAFTGTIGFTAVVHEYPY
jgi:hypothetical protein